MHSWARRALLLGAAFGLIGVMAGAFGAHGLADKVGAHDLETWRTAARYQQIHAVLVAAVGLASRVDTRALRAAVVLLLLGMLVFSGTLYAIVLGGPRMLGAITPLGGLCLMGGWGALAVHALRQRAS